MTAAAEYPSAIEKLPQEEGGYYVVRFPNIPGCLGVGDTGEEAQADAREALAACLDALKAIDRPPPPPSARAT
ncbi:type II toxin-antitoxin system HicB family antitoxin [Methylocystis sp. B8]|uniref:type II toxin-antitoxin system HicB family antitoxin n=1 Tax=Methylocystis sp. B8 TaxID=544938 RepID=UPI0010FEB64D|nr:type II toxin-antitoxin system HicB family antitoxin [Methylocystis sp. B8]TLG71315.1 type II toxin-antitoxin system HicB family antitoxin [Methylocystis sp. B8]